MLALVRASAPKLVAAAATVVAATLIASSAGAQSDEERGGARIAARDGIQAFEDQKYSKAIELLQRAESLVHAPTHLLYMARAQRALGRLVAAREAYMKVVQEELPKNSPRAFVEAQAAARKELAEVEPRIAKLTIVVEGAGSGEVQVRFDGQVMAAALVGIAVPRDPGVHRVLVSAPGKADQERELTLSEGSESEARFDVSQATPSAAAPVVATADASEPTEPTSVDEPTSSRRTWSYVLLGGGAAFVGVGATFGILAKGQRDDAMDSSDLCPDKHCTAAGRSEIDGATTKAMISTIGFAAGAVALGAGAYLLFTDPPKEAVAVTPLVGPHTAGLSWQGAF